MPKKYMENYTGAEPVIYMAINKNVERERTNFLDNIET